MCLVKKILRNYFLNKGLIAVCKLQNVDATQSKEQ